DLAAEGLAHGAAVDGLVVGVDGDRAALDATVTGDHTVGIGCVRFVGSTTQCADLHEGTGIKKRVDALSGGGTTLLVALLPGAFASRILGLVQPGAKVRKLLCSGGVTQLPSALRQFFFREISSIRRLM